MALNQRNDMKTTEEIKAEVFAYCKQVASDGDFLIRDRLWLLPDFDGFTCQRQNKANQGTQVFSVHPTLDADDPHWAVAYSVMGLEARDAVAEKDLRITELKDELLRLTREQEANCEEYVKTLTQDADYGLNQELKAERGRSSALAEALESFMGETGFKPVSIETFERAKAVLEAHKKGATT